MTMTLAEVSAAPVGLIVVLDSGMAAQKVASDQWGIAHQDDGLKADARIAREGAVAVFAPRMPTTSDAIRDRWNRISLAGDAWEPHPTHPAATALTDTPNP
jgi:hypothetical protein